MEMERNSLLVTRLWFLQNVIVGGNVQLQPTLRMLTASYQINPRLSHTVMVGCDEEPEPCGVTVLTVFCLAKEQCFPEIVAL